MEPPVFDTVPDIRLIAVDMDGSLLDDEKRIHDDFWPLLDELGRRGILLCPASGRQYATLRRQLGRDELVYIAENGAYVVQHDEEISVGRPRPAARRGRSSRRCGRPTSSTWAPCCAASGRRTWSGPTTRSSTRSRPYYARLETVDDLTAVDDEVLKVAVYDFGTAATAQVRCCEPFRTPWCPASTGST